MSGTSLTPREAAAVGAIDEARVLEDLRIGHVGSLRLDGDDGNASPADAEATRLPLGQALYNERGDVLAQTGVKLDTGLLDAIKSRGYTAVFVEDKQSEGIAIVDPVSFATRTKATKATRPARTAAAPVASLSPSGLRPMSSGRLCTKKASGPMIATTKRPMT